MRICHMTSVHVPFDTRIFHKECRALADAGHEVHLIAHTEREGIVDGIHMHPIREHKGRIRRMFAAPGEVRAHALALDCDVYHFHDPELLPVGIRLAAKGFPVIYDAHEDYPDYFRHRSDFPVPVRLPASWIVGAIEWAGAKRFAAVVVPTPAIERRFKRLGARTVMVRNYPIINDEPETVPETGRRNEAVYVGSLTFDRGVREMVIASAAANAKTGIRLQLAGEWSRAEGTGSVQNMPEFSAVDYHGRTSREQTTALLTRARMGLIPFHASPHYMKSYPTKLFEYMAAGLPVISSDFPLCRHIFEETGCGIAVEPGNAGALADAMITLAGDPVRAREMGERGREAVRHDFNWDNEAAALLELYNSLGRRV